MKLRFESDNRAVMTDFQKNLLNSEIINEVNGWLEIGNIRSCNYERYNLLPSNYVHKQILQNTLDNKPA